VFGEIRNRHGERIDCSFHPGRPGRSDLVVLGHGVTGNKDRAFLVGLAEALEAEGIAALRISFSGNGGSEGRFEESTVSKEVEDLGAVLDTLDGWRVAYAGHSMGAAVGVLRASRDDRIRALVSLAGMVDCAAFAARKFGAQEPDASLMWDKPECPLSRRYMDDMRTVGSVAERGADIAVPWLLVHGTADTVVPVADSRDILALAREDARLVELNGVDHVFTDEGTPRMVEVVVGWFGAVWEASSS
jgi:pimeloyl-ACP methyl ester carboxylesterase